MKRRRLVFDDFSQVREEMQHLLDAGYARVGQWSLGQMCDHLAKSFDGTIDGFEYSAPWMMRVLARQMLPRILREKKVPTGVNIPEGFEPAAEIADEAGLKRLEKALARFEQHTENFVAHPIFGDIGNERWRQLQLIHCAHHLSFLLPNS